jgi:sugar/nucleoside kinase (ribokinase family)
MTNDFIPDYLLIGHIAHDVTPRGPQLGGTVSYASFTAAAFGLRVAILTSARPDEPLLRKLLPNVAVEVIPSENTTTFENRYNGNVRTQMMYHRAHTLTADMVPPAWRKAKLVHLGPIAYEIDPAMMDLFDSPICITPQGWMRHREPDARVTLKPWLEAERVLSRADLTVLSEEDIHHNPSLEHAYAEIAPIMVLTRAERGCTVYQNGKRQDFTTTPIPPLDPTGAGDVFATSLHITLRRMETLESAVRAAMWLAGQSVLRVGFEGAPTKDEVEYALSTN